VRCARGCRVVSILRFIIDRLLFLMPSLRSLLSVSALAVSTACTSAGGSASVSSISVPQPSLDALAANATFAGTGDLPCTDCDAIPMPADITRAVETRIADLKARGGTCSRYGTILETSYRRGRIIIRPFMWRVGSHLASGEAKPNGDMTLAREIDSLNVGVRTVDDVLWSMEHEAVHIAFDLASGGEASEVEADRYVRSCKS
jgi:hypothetical protein